MRDEKTIYFPDPFPPVPLPVGDLPRPKPKNPLLPWPKPGDRNPYRPGVQQ